MNSRLVAKAEQLGRQSQDIDKQLQDLLLKRRVRILSLEYQHRRLKGRLATVVWVSTIAGAVHLQLEVDRSDGLGVIDKRPSAWITDVEFI